MRSLRPLFVAVLALLATSARAQRGIDSETFRPAIDGYGLFAIERAETSPQWTFGFRLVVDHAQSPLRLPMKSSASDANPALQTVMERQEVVHLGAHVGLTDWLELAIDVPISAVSYASIYGSPLVDATATSPAMPTGFYAAQARTNIAPPTAGPLDPRVAIKARTRRFGPLGLALIVAATVPFGDQSAFLGDSGYTLRPNAVVDLRFGRVAVVLNGGAIVRNQTTVLDPVDVVAGNPKPAPLLSVGTEATAGFGLAVSATSWLGFAAEADALIPLTSGPNLAPADYVLDALAGARFLPGRDITISVGGGLGLLASRRHDDFRAFLGIGWTPTKSAAGRRGPSGDRDRDGVPDNADACPDEPEDKDGFEDEDGCPDPDNDGDGIPDAADACPNQAEDRDGYRDEDGCPDPDNDGDGVPDVNDHCPDEAEDKDGFDDADGCPDPDNDGDGIPDVRDRCPNEPETANGIDDDDGCPDSGGLPSGKPGAEASGAFEAVLFERGKAQPGAAASSVLDALARRLGDGLAGRRLRIQGHTDGEEARHASGLSLSRAEAVRDELIKRGVDKARLEAVGLGATRPIAPNRTSSGRARNRRVDFSLVEP